MKHIIEYINESHDNKEYANLILVSPDKEILILRRANYMRKFKSMWGFPGGAVDQKDKSPKHTAIRELEEETSIKLSWNEDHNTKLFDKITNKDNSISYYYITELETTPNVKISREHSKYAWFHENDKENYKWMPDVFQIIQKVYD